MDLTLEGGSEVKNAWKQVVSNPAFDDSNTRTDRSDDVSMRSSIRFGPQNKKKGREAV
jgi:hypothetical protein